MPSRITLSLSDLTAGRNGRPGLPDPPGDGPNRLRGIAEQLNGGSRPAPITVRTLVNWFGYSRRSSAAVELIENNLSSFRLKTEPDFRYVWLDTEISFVPLSLPDSSAVETGEEPAETASNVFDPTQRLSLLKAANNRPVSVKPEQSLSEALTLMMLHDYTQLPVMSGEREVKGVVTFATIAKRLALGAPCTSVRDCMERPLILDADTPLFEAIDDIVGNEFVLVRAADKKITGIVTTSDLSLEFKRLTEPFLLLAEIERHIRVLIERAGFSIEELRGSVEDDQKKSRISEISDLNFGSYVRLLQEPERWRRLNLKLDCTLFNKNLDKVREIRNVVMHFDPDPLDDQDLQLLREFLALLRGLPDILADVRQQDSHSVSGGQPRQRT
jgi:CBS domain-containing protein